MGGELAGRVALVTGGSRGIGAATARLLAGRGCAVVLCARGLDALRRVAEEISATGGEVAIEACDLAGDDVAGMVGRAVARWGRLDILINAAGVGRLSSLIDGAPEDWDMMWRVNVRGLALVTRVALEGLDPERGHVVNIGSLSGHRVPPTGGFYAATKFAVRALGEGLRAELRGRGSAVRVTTVSPGFVDTELLVDYLGAAGRSVADIGHPILSAEDVAELVMGAVLAPLGVEVNDVLVRPRAQRA
jgi:17beta-estradiol 17-dehydrogenase / 3beta-hydroxysteroid 3-dehydrogenase